MEPVAREAHNSQEYVEAGATSLFQALPPAPTQIEEEFQDKVTVQVDGDTYEILPYSNRRMKVIRHFEGVTDRQVEASNQEWLVQPDTHVEVKRTGPGDKELMEQNRKILAYNRLTHDPELWAILERLRAPRQELTFTLPAGYTFDRRTERKLRKLVDHLAHGKIKPALRLLSDISADIDENKVIPEHSHAITSGLKKLLHRSV